MRLLLLVFALFCYCILTVLAGRPFEFRNIDDVDIRAEQPKYRLPNNTKPLSYDISLITRIDQGDFDFMGVVRIQLLVLEKSHDITVHARQLTVKAVRLTSTADTEVPLLPYSYDITTEFLTIPIRDELLIGDQFQLEIEYSGELRKDNNGFYRSSYVNAQGIKTWLATTQFESTNARHAFPCYDEPALKANFTIHIQHSAHYSAISNMPETRLQNPDRTVTTNFATTPLTSTYLIAFIVSDFKFKASAPENVIRHRVFVKPNEVEKTTLALSEGEKILNAISNYLQVPFSLPKMDQAGIPDFNPGAMENWGLVTYREQYLLWDQNVNVYKAKTRMTTIISHEFGHQWFGNLVSPKWWNYVWLNEGFATLFEHIGTDLVHPDWNIFQSFVTGKLQPVFQIDASIATRPMTQYAESPDGIARLFDSIAYAKSGSVLRMFLHAFSEGSFQKGLKYYLTDKAYQAAVEDDLFASLDRALKEDKKLDENVTVKEIFGSWSNQKGFPLLKVTRNYNNGSIMIFQERYYTAYPSPENDSSTWWIAFNIASANNTLFNDTSPNGWLPQGQRSRLIESTAEHKWPSDEWLVFNKQQTGYYRVLYDEKNYELLTKELTSGDLNKIHPVSRAQIIDDLNDFVRTGRIPHNVFFDLIKYLKRETEYAPWASAQRAINELSIFLAGSTEVKNFYKFVASLVEPFYQNIGLNDADDEPHLKKYLREIATNLACGFGVKICLNETYTKMREILASGKIESQHNRALIYINGIRSANSSETKLLWNRFNQTSNQDERSEILSSYGSISSEEMLEDFLNWTTFENQSMEVTKVERFTVINSVAVGSQSGLSVVIRLLLIHIDDANNQFANLDQLFINIASRIVTHEMHNQFSTLLDLAKEKNLLTDELLDFINKIIAEKFKWLDVHREPIESYLKHLFKPVSSSYMLTSSMAILPIPVLSTIRFSW